MDEKSCNYDPNVDELLEKVYSWHTGRQTKLNFPIIYADYDLSKQSGN